MAPPPTAMAARRVPWWPVRLGLAGWLVAVSLLAFVPMLLFSSVVVYRQIAAQQARGEDALQRRAQAAAAAIAGELDSALDKLAALAKADTLARGDMRSMHRYAQRVVEGDAALSSISLCDEHGQQLLNTRVPFGQPLPVSAVANLQAPLFIGRPRAVSPLISGDPDGGAPSVEVGVPVVVGTEVRYALRATIDLGALAARLNAQAWPADWTATVVDEHFRIVVRSRDGERYVGEPATPSLIDKLRAGAGVAPGITKDGTEVLVATAPVPGSGWYVAVGQPMAALKAQVR